MLFPPPPLNFQNSIVLSSVMSPTSFTDIPYYTSLHTFPLISFIFLPIPPVIPQPVHLYCPSHYSFPRQIHLYRSSCRLPTFDACIVLPPRIPKHIHLCLSEISPKYTAVFILPVAFGSYSFSFNFPSNAPVFFILLLELQHPHYNSTVLPLYCPYS